jgi:magnesium transporter
MMTRVKIRGKQDMLRVPHPHAGAAPGTIIVDPNALPSHLSVIAYGPQDHMEAKEVRPQELRELLGRWPVLWVNVDGLGSAEVLMELGEVFGIHRLALEDVVNVPQRPKIEEYGEHLFVVARMVLMAEKLEFEQVSIYFGRNFVLTFHEGRLQDCLDPVRERIRKSIYRIRGAGPDYLMYAVLDSIIDGYFPILEEYGEQLEELEDVILERPEKKSIAQVYDARRYLLTLRRSIWPLRDAFNTLLRDPPSLIAPETQPFLRDCADHAGQLIDLIESQRDLCAGMMDVYLSSASNRMNEIMKFLTMMSAIFIPLSFIAGIYGMNFDPSASPYNMPELRWLWGYPFVVGMMMCIAVGLVAFFRRKGWF